LIAGFGALLLTLSQLLMSSLPAPVVPAPAAKPASDVFELPLASWKPHCLGFGSPWTYCDGTPLRECANGAVWRHTGADEIAAVGTPVRAAANGVIIGYLVDPQFRGGVLIRSRTTFGVVITQYWHVWLRGGFAVGVAVKRGQVFANVASMGSRTHFHFAVYRGDYEPHAWNGALPPAPGCSGFPAFPYRFVNPTAFVSAHSAA
jgi:murein DD-endopeptidase MepM/ murein hydrolase activator NlpD